MKSHNFDTILKNIGKVPAPIQWVPRPPYTNGPWQHRIKSTAYYRFCIVFLCV